MALRWSQADLEAAIRKSHQQQAIAARRLITTMVTPKANKYHAKRVQVDNIWFDSKREAARYAELKLMIKAGHISSLEVHPVFPIDYDWKHICDVELDFGYIDTKTHKKVFEDVKSSATDNPLSKLKRKLVEAVYSITVEIVK